MLLHLVFTVVCDKFAGTCTWSFPSSPYPGDQPLPSTTCPCAQTGFVSRVGWDRCEPGLDKCILFLQRGEGLVGLTAGDGCPTSHQTGCEGWGWRGRGGEEHVLDGMKRMRRWVLRSRCDPPFSLPCCLNKSCSRSFYLHMLTGTSEFPRETTRANEMKGEKKKQRKRQREIE